MGGRMGVEEARREVERELSVLHRKATDIAIELDYFIEELLRGLEKRLRAKRRGAGRRMLRELRRKAEEVFLEAVHFAHEIGDMEKHLRTGRQMEREETGRVEKAAGKRRVRG
jgi:hypothetical protein